MAMTGATWPAILGETAWSILCLLGRAGETSQTPSALAVELAPVADRAELVASLAVLLKLEMIERVAPAADDGEPSVQLSISGRALVDSVASEDASLT